MPKSSRAQIDRDEKKILAELQTNAKESIDNIAKKCGFSRQKVWRIIKRLEKNKTIWGYYAVADFEKLELKHFYMLIKRSNKPAGDAIDKIVKLTIHKKGEELGVNVICSSYLHGAFDWLFILTSKDIKQIKRFSESLMREYQQIIDGIELLENIFPVKKCGMVNPNIERFKELF